MTMSSNKGQFKKKEQNFTIVCNSIIKNPNISLRAKGLYMLIQSYITIPDFTLSIVLYIVLLSKKVSLLKFSFPVFSGSNMIIYSFAAQ